MPTLTEEEVGELWEEYLKTRRVETRNRLVVHYFNYTRTLARMLVPIPPPGCDFEDLVAVGNLALVQTMERYRLDRGADFLTFSCYRICGAIRDELRRFGRARRVLFKVGNEVVDQSPSMIAEEKELIELAMDGINNLRPEDQQAIILHDFESRTFTEIGIDLARNKSVISRRWSRGIRTLQRRMLRVFV